MHPSQFLKASKLQSTAPRTIKKCKTSFENSRRPQTLLVNRGIFDE